MAEAILRALEPSLEVFSAGTNPAPAVHPKALQVLSEIGIQHPNARPKHVDEFLANPFEEEIVSEFRRVRDEIKRAFTHWVQITFPQEDRS